VELYDEVLLLAVVVVVVVNRCRIVLLGSILEVVDIRRVKLITTMMIMVPHKSLLPLLLITLSHHLQDVHHLYLDDNPLAVMGCCHLERQQVVKHPFKIDGLC
jgi:hypothetical protein